LVSVAWLEAGLAGRDDVLVVDCRWYLGGEDARSVYEQGHIPDARFVDLDRDLSSPVAPGVIGGRHPLPDLEAFAGTLARLGIGERSIVVAYDDRGGGIAARLWWLLRYVGHAGGRVLDGGIDAWREAGHALETGASETEGLAVEPVARMDLEPAPQMVVDVDAVMARSDRSVLIDARSAERFAGESEPLDPRAGHIPGAINHPWAGNLVAGAMASDATLKERFAGAMSADEIIAYCGSGVTACHDLLALAIAGRDDGKLYVGSWSDWCSDPRRPASSSKR
jgi:thiosulfate/3-mercaptopyruvate sulfurtransferase